MTEEPFGPLSTILTLKIFEDVVKKANNNWLRITLIEGKNNQIRKMFDRLGFPVVKLRRTQIGFLKDNRLKPGEYRLLSKREIDRFKSLSREFSKTA